MSIILHIDTATEFASVCLSNEQNVLSFQANQEQKNHASFLQPAIKNILKDAGLTIHEINAIAVTNGPGSYTGLRVGLASAKGLCFVLNKPLITLNTLEVMAVTTIKKINEPDFLYCPMIDARRMEVFTTLFTHDLLKVSEQQAMILNEFSFADYLQTNKIVFSGSGSEKAKSIINSNQAIFEHTQHNAKHMIDLANKKFQLKLFSDLAYVSPDYGKAFYTTAKRID